MTKNVKIAIGVGVVLIILVLLFVFNKKQEAKPGMVTATDPLTTSGEKTINSYTREEYALMGYSKADLDLLFS